MSKPPAQEGVLRGRTPGKTQHSPGVPRGADVLGLHCQGGTGLAGRGIQIA